MVGTARQIIRWMTEVKDENQEYEVKKHFPKRTRSQNAYYWELLGQLADVLRMSKPELHNRMLREYGQRQVVGGQIARLLIKDIPGIDEAILKSESVHYLPLNQVTTMADGCQWRTYVELKGSRYYNTREMAILLDGLIQEAQQQGIETLTPHELQKMREYEAKLESRRKARQVAQEARNDDSARIV